MLLLVTSVRLFAWRSAIWRAQYAARRELWEKSIVDELMNRCFCGAENSHVLRPFDTYKNEEKPQGGLSSCERVWGKNQGAVMRGSEVHGSLVA